MSDLDPEIRKAVHLLADLVSSKEASEKNECELRNWVVSVRRERGYKNVYYKYTYTNIHFS